MAVLLQIRSHPATHDAETDDSDIHMHTGSKVPCAAGEFYGTLVPCRLLGCKRSGRGPQKGVARSNDRITFGPSLIPSHRPFLPGRGCESLIDHRRVSSRTILSWRNSAYAAYAISLGSAGAAVWLTVALQSINPRIPGLPLLFCAAILSAWFGGIGPAMLVALISAAAIALNLVPVPWVGDSFAAEVPRLLVASVAVFFVSWIGGKQRQAEEQLRRVRDDLEGQIQIRTAELQRANQELRREIDERKVAEAARQAIAAELAHVSRLTMMGELTASIAHEVNQPLGAIMNYANACRRLLAAGADHRVQVDEALASIADDAQRASAVIARLRALAKKKPTEKTLVGIKSLIDDVVAIAGSKLLARGITLRVELDAELPPLRVDRVQIQQVLLNLVINAIEAMDAMPPAARVLDIRARAGNLEKAAAIVVIIRDRGTGIRSADQCRLFDAFYTTKADGVGLGLAISRSIVESHGGRLNLVPTEGPGASFQIVLPAEEPAIS